MNFVSLFAGVGGFDLAFERAGMDCVAQVEIDAKCREVLATHWPDVPRFEDVYEVSGLDDLGSTDVMAGGFPCQDYSVAGKRGGLAGDRGALWWQFHRLIAECRPRWVVGENVPGLLSSNGGRDFGAIVGSLVELGYGVVWRVLDAQYFGVAQRRRRVFIVGHSGGVPRPEILAFAEGCSGDTPPVRVAGQAAAPTLAARINGGGGLGTDHDLDGGLVAFNWQSGQNQLSARESHIDALHAGQTPAIAFTAKDSGGDASEDVSPTLRSMNFDKSHVNGGGQVAVAFQLRGREGGAMPEVEPDDIAGALRAGDGGSSRGRLLATLQEVGARESKNQNGVGIGIADSSLMYTLQAGQQHGLAFTSAVRRLTPLECERLQGFPDNWTASQSDTQRYRQMGNAVAVPVVEWIGNQLVKADV